MSESTFRIVELAVKLLVAVLATYVVPAAARWIRQQLIQTEIGKAVLAAQQTLWKQSGETRKDFAMRVARAALPLMVGCHFLCYFDELFYMVLFFGLPGICLAYRPVRADDFLCPPYA